MHFFVISFVVFLFCNTFTSSEFVKPTKVSNRITKHIENEKDHNSYKKSNNNNMYDLQENAFLTTPELITKHGYPSEVFHVTTEDGYILELHRIPRKGGKPVLLQHGLLDSSSAFILMGPQQGLGYFLWDLGFDVWMGNSRGNRYSRKHITLDEKDDQFWSFSWHEMGMYDIPATIDFILNATEYSKLYYIGHSQGTTIFWVMCSERPQYNNKVVQMHAFAPVAFLSHVRGAGVLLRYTLNIFSLTTAAGIKQILPANPLVTTVGMAACRENSVIQRYCSDFLFLLAGYDYEQMNQTVLPVIYGHMPAGSSMNQLIHYGQLIKSGNFCQFDYGFLWNIFKYKNIEPPCYNLTKVIAPIYLYYSANDYLSSKEDAEKLSKSLPNVVEKYLVPMQAFNHLDFIWGIDARALLYNHVVEAMKRSSNHVMIVKKIK